MRYVADYIYAIGGCSRAFDWAIPYRRSFKKAYEECNNPSWLFTALRPLVSSKDRHKLRRIYDTEDQHTRSETENYNILMRMRETVPWPVVRTALKTRGHKLDSEFKRHLREAGNDLKSSIDCAYGRGGTVYDYQGLRGGKSARNP